MAWVFWLAEVLLGGLPVALRESALGANALENGRMLAGNWRPVDDSMVPNSGGGAGAEPVVRGGPGVCTGLRVGAAEGRTEGLGAGRAGATSSSSSVLQSLSVSSTVETPGGGGGGGAGDVAVKGPVGTTDGFAALAAEEDEALVVEDDDGGAGLAVDRVGPRVLLDVRVDVVVTFGLCMAAATDAGI